MPLRSWSTLRKTSPSPGKDLATIQAAISASREEGDAGHGRHFHRRHVRQRLLLSRKTATVLTAGHVAARPKSKNATVIFPPTANRRSRGGKTLGMNYDMDSGMLKIVDEGKYPHVDMGRSKDLKLGQWCITLGHPGGHSAQTVRPSCEPGEFSFLRDDAIAHRLRSDGGAIPAVRCWIPMAASSGIHSRISEEIIDNYHVPIDTFRDTWDRLAKGEAWGGPHPRTDSGNQRAGRPEWLPNHKRLYRLAGRYRGPQKTTTSSCNFAGQPVKGLLSLQVMIAQRKAGDEVTLKVRRGEENARAQSQIIDHQRLAIQPTTLTKHRHEQEDFRQGHRICLHAGDRHDCFLRSAGGRMIASNLRDGSRCPAPHFATSFPPPANRP